MHTDAEGSGEAAAGEQANGLRQRASGGNDVVDQHRRATSVLARRARRIDLDLRVAAPGLAQDDVRRSRQARDVRRPLGALGVGADNQRSFDVRTQPCSDGGRALHHDRAQRIDLIEGCDPVQVRVDGDEPLVCGRDQAGEAPRRHGFAGPKARVLTHVGKVRGDQADADRAEVAQRIGQQQQAGQLSVGVAHFGDNRDVAAGNVTENPQVRLAVREPTRLQRAQGRPEPLGETRRCRLRAWQREHAQRPAAIAHEASIATIGAWASTYANA